jgi:hypothetical protein
MTDIIKNMMITQTIRKNSIIQKIGDIVIVYKLSGKRKKKRPSYKKNKRGGANGAGDSGDAGDANGAGDAKGDDKKDEGAEGAEGAEGVSNSSKDENGKCVGKDSCAGEKTAKNLQSTANDYRDGEKIVKDKMHNALTNLTDKAKCPMYVAEKIPDIIPNMITKIGESTAGAFDNVSNSIKNLFDQVSGQEIKGYPDIFGPFEVAYASVVTKIQDVINKAALGADANKILSDPEVTSGELLDKMMRNSKMYKDVVKEAELRDVFKDWMKNYTDALLETLDIAKPEIDRINNEISNIIEGMGDNVGKSLSHSLVNVGRSIVSNIPIVGGIVSAVLSADELGQEILNACRPPVAKGAGIIMPVVNGVNKQVDKTKCQVNELAKKIEPIMKKIESASSPTTSTQQGGGGRGKTVKNIGKKINNSTRCVKYMLSRFSNKNITRRNKWLKNHKKTVKDIKV